MSETLSLLPARSVAFTLWGEATAEGRGRAAVNAYGHATIYTPAKTKKWKQRVSDAAREAMGSTPRLEAGPVRLTIRVYFERPSTMVWKTRPMPEVPAERYEDWDNLGKAISDGMNGIVYRDDRQVAVGVVEKWICAGPGYGEVRPRVEVEVEEMRSA